MLMICISVNVFLSLVNVFPDFVKVSFSVFLWLTELSLNNYFKFFLRQIVDLHFFGDGYWKIIGHLWWCHLSLTFHIP